MRRRSTPGWLFLALLLSACTSTSAPAPILDSPPQRAEISLPRRLSRQPVSLEALQLPRATRQIREGYWLGAMIHPADVPALARLGVRVVLSAVEPSEKTLFALHEAGIFQFSVPMGATFRHSRTILDVVDHFAPEQVFIHCRHGADRTGAIAAFLLVVRHDWTIADAFYSVLYASQPDVDGLAEVLAQFAITDHRSIDDPSVGFYSVAAAGGVGGLKTRNRRYAQMVSTTVEAIQGIRLAEQGQTACPTPVVPSMVTTP